MAKKNDRQMVLVRGQIIFILYNDNTYVVVHCKNILHPFRWNFYVIRSERQRKTSSRPVVLLQAPIQRLIYPMSIYMH